MRTRRGAATATFLGNALSLAAVSVQSLALVPLYLDAVGPRLYGAWLASGEVLVWLQSIDLGIPNLIIQRIATADAQGNQRAAARWLSSGVVLLSCIAVAVALCGVPASVVLTSWLSVTPEEGRVLQGTFIVGVAATGASILANGFVGLSRAIQDTAFMSLMLVMSVLVGIGVTVALLLDGFGLWAIGFGLLARALVLLGSGVVFAWRIWPDRFGTSFEVNRHALSELALAAPATGLGGVSYAVMTQSEIVLIAGLVRPEAAVVYALTRRAADVGRAFVDMLGFASYGGFAHVVGSDQKAKILQTRSEILSLHLTLGVAVAAAYVAVNRSLVDAWVGPSHFGGIALTAFMALQGLVLGHSYLINLLYRATGRVIEGSLALIAEALVRVPLLAAVVLTIGPIGVPLAAAATALGSAVVTSRLTARALGGASEPSKRSSIVWVARVACLALGVLAAFGLFVPSWWYVFLAGFSLGLATLVGLVLLDPALVTLRGQVRSWAGNYRGGTT